MGLFLVLLGGVTFASKFWGAGILDQALTWWPVVFVLLGLEILMYTAWKGTRERIRYDLFSMFITVVLVFVVSVLLWLVHWDLLRKSGI